MSDGTAGEGLDELTQISQDLGLYDTDGANPMIRSVDRVARKDYTGKFANLADRIKLGNNLPDAKDYLSPENFCYWLQGFVELCDVDRPTELQWMMVKQHLQLVFNKQTSSKVDLVDILSNLNKSRKSELIC